jgi:hypothetical protein
VNVLVKIAETYVPPFLKKKELRNLMDLTASAFGSVAPVTNGLSFDECLAAFAQFSRSEVEKAIVCKSDLNVIKVQLYRNAYRLGERFRKMFSVSRIEDVMAVSRLLYRMLGIEFAGTAQGTVTIARCSFSAVYAPEQCNVMSSLDAGILAGLSRGGVLTFTQRITEGFDCCKARLCPQGDIR